MMRGQRNSWSGWLWTALVAGVLATVPPYAAGVVSSGARGGALRAARPSPAPVCDAITAQVALAALATAE